jgi:hypothetical protein
LQANVGKKGKEMRRATLAIGTILLIGATRWVSETRTLADDKTAAPPPNAAPLSKGPQPKEMGSTPVDQSQLQFPANFETKQSPQEAFEQLPDVYRITRAPFVNAPPDRGAPSTPNSTPPYLFTAVFNSAAQFPLPEFGLPNPEYGDAGPRMDRDGVIIEEGMFVRANADGHYEVRFVVRTPRMPVSLKLQLTILKSESISVGLYDTRPIRPDELTDRRPPAIKFAKSSRPVGTITLPTIYLKPDRTDTDTGEELAWLVTHEGYSRVLQQLLKEENGVVNCRLLRKGTARIGETFYEILNRQPRGD